MDNISSQIGALELGDHLASHNDGALEAAAANVDLGPSDRCRATLVC
jgi:hypothetical protein